MASPIVFDKTLAASSANNIAASQTPGSATLLLNGSAGTYKSTTSSAAAKLNATFIQLTSTSGLVAGQTVKDSTSSALSSVTTIKTVSSTGITIWPPVAGLAGVGNGDTIVLGGFATIDTFNASSNTAIGRRVIITSGGNDAGITWTIVGTNASGAIITEIVTGAGAGVAVQSNNDFVTVLSITPSGAVASTVTAGTNGVGSSPWQTLNWDATSDMQLGFAVEVVSGSVNFTVQHTYDDPNMLVGGATYPLPFDHPVVAKQNATMDGSYDSTIAAIRILINSGTGQLRFRILQASIG